MDAPILALRFRDPGTIDTIAEHRAVLVGDGSVWWGWWKKETEPSRDQLLKAIVTPSTILIIDRSTRRAFAATCLKVRKSNDPDIDRARVPAYYRDRGDEVAAWFLLSRIESVDFEEPLDLQFAASGNVTLLPLGTLTEAKRPFRGQKQTVPRSGVLHLSDIHFGSDFSFLKSGAVRGVGDDRCTFTDAVVQDLDRISARDRIGLILVTGDFTTRGDWSDETRDQILGEFATLRRALGLNPDQVVATPGNHDVVRYADGMSIDSNKIAVEHQKSQKHEREYRTFLDELTGRSWKEPLSYTSRFGFPDVDVDFVVLNSCNIAATTWTEYGYVGVGGYDALRELLNYSCTRPTYRIAALHHHLLPVNQVNTPTSNGVSLTLDAVEVLEVAAKAGVQLMVHGHQHLARVVRYQNLPRIGDKTSEELTIVSGGSAGVIDSRRGFERNTYSFFDVKQTGIHLILRELRPDGRQGSTLFDVALGVKPLEPTPNDIQHSVAAHGITGH